jgi:hypothetical protein
MDNPTPPQNPRFGLLLLVCFGAVIFCAVLTYVMVTYFPDF